MELSSARPAVDADLGNLLDPERGREAKQRRVRRLNEVFIPLLRAAGMALLFVLVAATSAWSTACGCRRPSSRTARS